MFLLFYIYFYFYFFRLEERTRKAIRSNTNQFPLSTVVVLWHALASGKPHAFDMDKIYDIMSEFGPIRAIDIVDQNGSANVVYMNLADSCVPIQVL